MTEPKLNQRDRRDILAEIRRLAAGYLPEWRWDAENPDAGVALAEAFAEMTEDTISRYSRTLRNHHLSFLNLLGAGLKPAKPAAGMVSVGLLPGMENAYIAKGTALYAAAETEAGRVFYETVEAMDATGAAISAIFFTSALRDSIVKAYDREEGMDWPVHLFHYDAYPQLQAHLLYFREDRVFQIRGDGVLLLHFFHSRSRRCSERLPQWLGAPENAVWEHFRAGRWTPVERTELLEDGVRLTLLGGNEPSTLEPGGEEGRYIRCRLQKLPEGGVRLMEASCEAVGENLVPDVAATDTQELPVARFCPFGEQLMIFSSFYLCCREAFVKAGSVISLRFVLDFRKIPIEASPEATPVTYRLIMSDEDFETGKERDVFIERVVWEYWNGRGWARLFPAGEERDFFTPKKGGGSERTLRFLCPADMEPVVMGAAEGPFIRARLDKLSTMVWTKGNYLTPFVHEVRVNYRYSHGPAALTGLTAISDCARRDLPLPQTGDEPVLATVLCPQPAMVVCLDAPLKGGPLRILFEMERGRGQPRPALRWEYLGRDGKGNPDWKNLEVVDGAKNFSQSAIVTLMGKGDFAQSTLYGKRGYFLRLVNVDGRYDQLDARQCPVMTAARFNTAPVVQLERRPSEYFFVSPGEENKRCALSVSGLREAEVWVDERGSLSVKEEAQFLRDPDLAQPVRDAAGNLTALWVRWRKTEQLKIAGPEERVFALDYAGSAVLFGDGRHGRVPPAKPEESVRISYVTCDGALGNIPAHGILDFMASPLGVSWVTNHKAITGGAGQETTEEASARVTGDLLSMGRLVSEEDLERVILASDRGIRQVKCSPHIDRFGGSAPERLAVAVLPQEYGQGEERFAGMAGEIGGLVRERGPLQLSAPGQLDIFEVRYVEICVHVEAAVSEYNLYHEVYQAVYDRLKAFLDPVGGNFDGGGWKIGRLPAREQIYNCVKSVRRLKWIKSLHIFHYMATDHGRQAVEPSRLAADPFAVPIFGEPDIQLTVERDPSREEW